MAKSKSRSPRVTPAHTLSKMREIKRVRSLRVTPFRPLRALRPTPLVAFEDRRQWNPERWGRPLRAFNRAATRVVVPNRVGPTLTPALAFADPRKVFVCIRRKTRREVLHALGKGGGGNKSPKRSPHSNIEC